MTDTEVVTRALRALADGDLEEYVACHHAEYANHEAALTDVQGADAARNTFTFLHRVFADLGLEPLQTIVGDGEVVVRLQFSGRQVGEVNGFAPSGRTCSVQHIHIFRVADGRIIEHWACRDDLGALFQLGLVGPSANPSS
jgi:predicted ester cyclase